LRLNDLKLGGYLKYSVYLFARIIYQTPAVTVGICLYDALVDVGWKKHCMAT